jgi:hypothetical protein
VQASGDVLNRCERLAIGLPGCVLESPGPPEVSDGRQRPPEPRRIADVAPVEHDFWRFYLLRP